jgi:hypothetical protein
MKIAGLISRFENKEVGNEPRLASDEQNTGDYHDNQREDQIRTTSRATSPGRLNIRNAIKNLRAPRSPGNLKHLVSDTEEPESVPLTVEARVDNVIKSIVSRRSGIEEITSSGAAEPSETDDETNDAGSRREFLISEHSNRTLVVDNKKNKSQSSVLPDTPWSSRNLTGSRQWTNAVECNQPQKYGTKQQHDHEAEYGTLALKCDDVTIKEEADESLPPEVVAMSALSEKKELKATGVSVSSPKKSRSMDDVLRGKDSSKKVKNLSALNIDNAMRGGDDSDGQRVRRRLSSGLLRRRGSNENTELKQKEIAVVPPENHKTMRAPTRSFSAGNLRMARSKAKSIRERKARSQSPGDESVGTRKIRPGRKKSERNLLAAKEEREAARGEDSISSSTHSENNETNETSEPPRSLRRIRGRSPGDDGKASTIAGVSKDSDDNDPSQRPSLNRLPSRGRSPGTIRKSIDMTGEVSRDVSPGALGSGRSPASLRRSNDVAKEAFRNGSPDALRRGRSPGNIRKGTNLIGEGSIDASPGTVSRSKKSGVRAKSPGTLRKMSSNKARSPGRYSSLHKSSSHSNGGCESPRAGSGVSDRWSPGSLRQSSHSIRARSPGTLSNMISTKKSPLGAREIEIVPQSLASSGSEIVVEPPAHLQRKNNSSGIEESESTVSANGLPPDDDLVKKNLSVPRSKSPGALARRPSKNPRAAQTKKAQSLFENKSPSPMLSSPRRRMSRDDASLRLSSFDETEAN